MDCPAGKALGIFLVSKSIHKEMDKHYDGINTGVWVLTIDDAEESNPTWATPKRFVDGIMMCSQSYYLR